MAGRRRTRAGRNPPAARAAGRLRDARRHRARGARPLARTAAAQRGLGNARPVAALVTRVPRANARWCVPQRLRDGASAGREHCVPRAVRALHCAIAFPPSLPIRCVGDNDDRSIRRGGAWHRPRRAVGRCALPVTRSAPGARPTKRLRAIAASTLLPRDEGGADGGAGVDDLDRTRPGDGEQHSCAPPGARARVMRRPSPQQPARFNRALSDLRAVDQRSVGIRRGRVMSYAACISTIRDRQRTTNSRRCVANGIDSPGRGGTRKYWRNSSKAAQS